ncbi:hypothetical protein [Salinigranum salinum]|jgi:hypothetical protein|uniref:hypothetical protein n=1 Tax=Salinigranum salinum TaxID=1364937 RepID=UPI00195B3C59|nr:hypothetical protein [Salinigranum salinum]
MEQFSGEDHIRSDFLGSLYEAAEMEAWTHVESFAEEARTEREREIDIKREHAERYFVEQIEDWKERLGQYQQRAEQGADMSAPIGNAKQKLESLRREREEERSHLSKRSTSRHRNQIL